MELPCQLKECSDPQMSCSEHKSEQLLVYRPSLGLESALWQSAAPELSAVTGALGSMLAPLNRRTHFHGDGICRPKPLYRRIVEVRPRQEVLSFAYRRTFWSYAV